MAASCYGIVEVVMAMVYTLQDTENSGKTVCYKLLCAHVWVRKYLVAVAAHGQGASEELACL